MSLTPLQQVFAAIDAANSEDPNLEGGKPKEIMYSLRMDAWLDKLAPQADPSLHNPNDELRIAAHGQHVRRWSIPRSQYDLGPVGYKKWRLALTRMHAETVAGFMAIAGYPTETIARMQSLMRKERLKTDKESQLLEDVVCLVFLESYFAEFSAKHDPEKVIDILRKTWGKMSAQGHAAALALPMPHEARALVERALA